MRALVLFVLGFLACSPCKPISSGDLCGDESVTVDGMRWGSLILIDAKVNGQPSRLFVDTGSANTLFSAKRAGYPDMTLMHDVALDIGDMHLQLMHAWFADSPLSGPTDFEPNGLIGTDILFSLDYQQAGTKITLSHQPLLCQGATIRTRDGGSNRPFLDYVLVNDVLLDNVLLDTGASTTLLDTAAVNQLEADMLVTSEPVGMCTFGGCTSAGFWRVSLDQVCIDSQCRDNVLSVYPAWNAIGQSWLRLYDTTIISIYRETLQVCP